VVDQASMPCAASPGCCGVQLALRASAIVYGIARWCISWTKDSAKGAQRIQPRGICCRQCFQFYASCPVGGVQHTSSVCTPGAIWGVRMLRRLVSPASFSLNVSGRQVVHFSGRTNKGASGAGNRTCLLQGFALQAVWVGDMQHCLRLALFAMPGTVWVVHH
jgi:hypothetical protein